MSGQSNRRWLLAERPHAAISARHFLWDEGPIASLEQGNILVRNLCLSCEPTQRGWMLVDTYLPAVRIGEVMRALAVGQVIASKNAHFAPGQLVQGLFGWQDYALVRDEGPYPILAVAPEWPIETSIGVLGNTGLTAYFGLLEIGKPRSGDTVLVSAAAGATGSIAGQIAKLVGARVVGIAGSPAKCRYLLDELGFDAAIDYKSENLLTRLRETCPHGIDVYFDNVGGRTLDMALLHLARHGRVVLCGAISGYSDAVKSPGPSNYMRLISQRGRMEGFIVLDFLQRAPEALDRLGAWLRAGKLKHRVDVLHGLENAPAALARLFTGENHGKQLVKLADAA